MSCLNAYRSYCSTTASKLLKQGSLLINSQSVRTKVRARLKRWHYGIYKSEGHEVHKGDLLVVQRFLNYHPGLNVKYEIIGPQRFLRSMCSGKVMITQEEADPDYSISEMEETYGWKKDVPIYKLTFNVIPEHIVGQFRLVEQI